MKTINNLKKYLGLAVLAIFIASCEKADLEENTTTVSLQQQEEGFKSTTGNSDSELENMSSDKPILHLKYRGHLSEGEANAKFEKDSKLFIEEYKKKNRGVSTEWFYRVATNTGTQSNNGTDGDVWATVTFKTNKGNKSTGYKELDNFGDDREEGDWDYYVFKTSFPGQAVSWVEAKSSCLALKGKDGWFIKRFYVQVYTSIQSIASSGYTSIISQPDVWLDSNSSSKFDYYCPGSIGTGRLNF